jgi:lysophospholipase L1-like esterase
MVRKIFCMIGLLVLGTVVFAAPAKTNPGIVPTHLHNDWTMRYLAINERVRQGNVDLIFIGDSITHAWEHNGKEVWQKYYGNRNAVNIGIGGDGTQHVLWRLEHGNIDGISPKAAVIMIGTNNIADEYTAQEISDGIIAVCNKVREKLPKTKILLLAIFPRGQAPSALRDKIAKISEISSKIADSNMIHYLDIGEKFLQQDKTISADVMLPDYVHLSPKGYQIWAEAIEPKLVELMGESKK